MSKNLLEENANKCYLLCFNDSHIPQEGFKRPHSVKLRDFDKGSIHVGLFSRELCYVRIHCDTILNIVPTEK